MARRKIVDHNIRKLTRMGGGRSIGVTLPIEMVKELKWREKQKVVIDKKGDRIIIKDWKKND
ncbi:AbrB/MazE/SpoVT family DNA-binding domain-containing protein [Candidatus Parcubacteria bacterium]|nr:AbrB/MazE/SpoVT family DNA-binding domain-containing protein [Candidatus Parcubacteria bacterium]